MPATELKCRSIAFASDSERSWLSLMTEPTEEKPNGEHIRLYLGSAQIALLNRHFAAHVADQYSLLAKPAD